MGNSFSSSLSKCEITMVLNSNTCFTQISFVVGMFTISLILFLIIENLCSESLREGIREDTSDFINNARAISLKLYTTAEKFVKSLVAMNKVIIDKHKVKNGNNPNAAVPSQQPRSASAPLLSSSIEAKNHASQMKASEASRPASANVAEQKKSNNNT
jgi:hypothetical protein